MGRSSVALLPSQRPACCRGGRRWYFAAWRALSEAVQAPAGSVEAALAYADGSVVDPTEPLLARVVEDARGDLLSVVTGEVAGALTTPWAELSAALRVAESSAGAMPVVMDCAHASLVVGGAEASTCPLLDDL